jgi:hypothetical protein
MITDATPACLTSYVAIAPKSQATFNRLRRGSDPDCHAIDLSFVLMEIGNDRSASGQPSEPCTDTWNRSFLFGAVSAYSVGEN